MTLTEIKAVVAAMFKKTAGDLTVNSIDLFLHAANNARRRAELLHDFESSRIVADLAIAGASGGLLSAVTNVQGSATGGVKSVTAVSRVDGNGYFRPSQFKRFDMALENLRSESFLDAEYWFNDRYQDDEGTWSDRSGIVQLGGKLYVYPYDSDATDTVNVRLVGFGWLPAYTTGLLGTADIDLFVTRGAEYLQWAAIVELNHYFKEFVARTEGNLPTPEKMRDSALRELILQDSYSVDANVTL